MPEGNKSQMVLPALLAASVLSPLSQTDRVPAVSFRRVQETPGVVQASLVSEARRMPTFRAVSAFRVRLAVSRRSPRALLTPTTARPRSDQGQCITAAPSRGVSACASSGGTDDERPPTTAAPSPHRPPPKPALLDGRSGG